MVLITSMYTCVYCAFMYLCQLHLAYESNFMCMPQLPCSRLKCASISVCRHVAMQPIQPTTMRHCGVGFGAAGPCPPAGLWGFLLRRSPPSSWPQRATPAGEKAPRCVWNGLVSRQARNSYLRSGAPSGFLLRERRSGRRFCGCRLRAPEMAVSIACA